jgi:hypothetical protein
MSEIELRWIKRTVHEEQFTLVKVTKGVSEEKLLEIVLEGDALYGDPHEIKTNQCDTAVDRLASEREIAIYAEPVDLTEETK